MVADSTLVGVSIKCPERLFSAVFFVFLEQKIAVVNVHLGQFSTSDGVVKMWSKLFQMP